MSRCFETLHVKDGKPLHVRFHNTRFWKSSWEVFGVRTHVDLASLIDPPMPECRCKIVYDTQVVRVEYAPLVPRVFRHFEVVSHDASYGYKFEDRRWLEALKNQSKADEIILSHQGLVQDTSIANLAFYIHGQWLTPAKPLLQGTARARWLEQGRIRQASLESADLGKAEKFAIMNALLNWQEYDVGVIKLATSLIKGK